MTQLIGVETIKATEGSADSKLLIYGGNIQGEVYIYEVLNINEALSMADDDSTQIPEAQLRLFDMVLTDKPLMVRQVTKVGETTWALCQETNKVQILQHNP